MDLPFFNGTSADNSSFYTMSASYAFDHVNGNDSELLNVTEPDDVVLLPLPDSNAGVPAGGPPLGPPPPPPPIVVQLQRILSLMQQYYQPSVIGVGFVGNFFAILVCIRSNLSKFSYVNYLIALFIADSCYLFNLLCLWLAEHGVNIYTLGAWCHFVIFLSQSSSFLSLWYLTGFLVDRFIALQMQFWERSLCTTVKAKIIVIGFAMVAIAVFLNISLTVGVIIAPGPKVYCTPLRRFAHSWKILDRMDIFINCMFPYLLSFCIFLVSVCSAHREGLLCNRRRRTVLGPHRTPQPIQIYDSDLEKGRTCLFLSYAFVHLLLNIPSQVIRLMQTFSMWYNPQQRMNVEHLMWHQFFSNIAHARPAINIFVLLLSYKGFRLAIKFLLIQMCKAFRKGCSGSCRSGRRRRQNPIAVRKQRRRCGNMGFERTADDSADSDEGAEIALTEVKVTDDISSE